MYVVGVSLVLYVSVCSHIECKGKILKKRTAIHSKTISPTFNEVFNTCTVMPLTVVYCNHHTQY